MKWNYMQTYYGRYWWHKNRLKIVQNCRRGFNSDTEYNKHKYNTIQLHNVPIFVVRHNIRNRFSSSLPPKTFYNHIEVHCQSLKLSIDTGQTPLVHNRSSPCFRSRHPFPHFSFPKIGKEILGRLEHISRFFMKKISCKIAQYLL